MSYQQYDSYRELQLDAFYWTMGTFLIAVALDFISDNLKSVKYVSFGLACICAFTYCLLWRKINNAARNSSMQEVQKAAGALKTTEILASQKTWIPRHGLGKIRWGSQPPAEKSVVSPPADCFLDVDTAVLLVSLQEQDEPTSISSSRSVGGTMTNSRLGSLSSVASSTKDLYRSEPSAASTYRSSTLHSSNAVSGYTSPWSLPPGPHIFTSPSAQPSRVHGYENHPVHIRTVLSTAVSNKPNIAYDVATQRVSEEVGLHTVDNVLAPLHLENCKRFFSEYLKDLMHR